MQVTNSLLTVVQQPELRDVRRLAARRERLERQVFDMQQKEAALLEASRKTAATKGPPRAMSMDKEDGELKRPAVQHLAGANSWHQSFEARPRASTTRHGAAAIGIGPGRNARTAGRSRTPDKLTEWNSVLVYQAPNYQTQRGEGSQEDGEGDGYIDELDCTSAHDLEEVISDNGVYGTTDIVDYAGGFGSTDLFDYNGRRVRAPNVRES